jgi:uncharacterized protein YyaL (SSP411 family)
LKGSAEDKPIFLSSGYSTCHWCHVMERESFENEEIAALINEGFVPVKVDREERPDVDLTYMTYVQAASGHGGWPMSVSSRPELKPFYGGTYYPPVTKGRIGFKNLLGELHESLEGRSCRCVGACAQLAIDKLQEHLESEKASGRSRGRCRASRRPTTTSRGSYDYHEGRLQRRAEVPAPHGAQSALPHSQALRESEGIARRTGRWRWPCARCARMANGGMRDHLGGGFHRYSVDGYWHIPHYEKMLYDQAQLLTPMPKGYQLTGSVFLARSRDRSSPMSSAISRIPTVAFSPPKTPTASPTAETITKREGAFYVWTGRRDRRLLGKEEGSIFRYAYGARRDGNARPESDPQGELKGLNTLFRAFSAKKTAEYFKKTPRSRSDPRKRARNCSSKPATSARVRISMTNHHRLERPHDLRPRSCRSRARRCEFITLAEQPRSSSTISSVASPARACIAVGARTARPQRPSPSTTPASSTACSISIRPDPRRAAGSSGPSRCRTEMDSLFLDKENGGYYSVHTDMPDSVLRIKEDYDGAEPSPNSLAALNLARLRGPDLPGTRDHGGRAEEAARGVRPLTHAFKRLGAFSAIHS